MAPRRLIIAMVLLLGVSTAIAVFAPRKDFSTNTGTTGATGVTSSTGATGVTGDSLAPRDSKTVVASVKQAKTGKPAPNVVAAPGDRLVLSVQTTTPGDVRIDGLGLTETAAPYAPARFDVLMPPDPLPDTVVDVSSGKVIARIVPKPVKATKPSKAPKPAGKQD